jgi:hemerythrin-like domain-containing protein
MTVKLTQVLEELREDHRNMAVLLNLLETECESAMVDETPDFELLQDIMQYMIVYSDAVHHPKEDLVYDVLRNRGAEYAEGLEGVGPDHRDIAVLGTTLRDDIQAIISGAAVTREQLITDLRSYVDRLRKHMSWEEEDLFDRADTVAAEDEEAGIDAAVFRDDDPLFGATRKTSFLNLLSHLQEYDN